MPRTEVLKPAQPTYAPLETVKTKLVLFFVMNLICLSVFGADKPRLFVLTDIGGDPDDQMSMVRLMTYANHMEIEGLVATHVEGQVNPEQI